MTQGTNEPLVGPIDKSFPEGADYPAYWVSIRVGRLLNAVGNDWEHDRERGLETTSKNSQM